MAKKGYPILGRMLENNALEELWRYCQELTRTRNEDVKDFTNLSNIFMRGRKVGKIPSGSADIVITDRPGDFNYDANYMYICVDNSGATWRRITLGSW